VSAYVLAALIIVIILLYARIYREVWANFSIMSMNVLD